MKEHRIRLGQLGNHPTIAFAVAELTKYLKRMDPALNVEVIEVPAPTDRYPEVIWVGQSEQWAGILPQVKDPVLDDSIAVSVQGRSGYITGTNARSVLIAAYRFLKALGCDWVRPGAEGERIPTKPIENMTVEIHETPSYRHRGVCIEGAVNYENVYDMIDYLPKVGMNEYFVQFVVPCTFFERWYSHEHNKYLEEEPISRDEIAAMIVKLEDEIVLRGLCYHKVGHGWTCEPFGIDGSGWHGDWVHQIPEESKKYLAQLDGERQLFKNVPLNTNLCYSNPQVRDTMNEAITRYCKENPQVDVLHFWLADGHNNQCECDECAKHRPADWYVKMLNELDEKMTAAGVNTKIVFLVYVDLLWEPMKERLNNPDRFILMYAPITRYYGQTYGDCLEFDGELAPYDRNKLTMPGSLAHNLAHLRRWQAQFDGDSFCFDYHLMWAHIGDPGYERSARNLFQDMKDLHKIGLDGMVSCQIQRCFFPTAMPFNMMAAALWDEHSCYEEQAKAYYRSAYGADGLEVYRLLTKVSDLLLMYDGPSFGLAEVMNNGPFCSDYAALEEAKKALAALADRHAQDTDACQVEWAQLKYFTEYLTLLVRAFQSREAGDEEAVQATLEQIGDLAARNEVTYQKTLDVSNLHKVLVRRFNSHQ